jgi:hypothetical protein
MPAQAKDIAAFEAALFHPVNRLKHPPQPKTVTGQGVFEAETFQAQVYGIGQRFMSGKPL